MGTARRWVALAIFGAWCLTFAQTESKGTRRHVRVAEQDPSVAALAQAEDAISKKDYANAEKALVPITQRDPENYQAWFDLGFTLNALGRTDESIAAYRKSVTAKPDVFESNFINKRGDLLFWGPDGSQHVALYLGGSQMLEASGSTGRVAVSPVRRGGLQPYAARIIES